MWQAKDNPFGQFGQLDGIDDLDNFNFYVL